VVAELVSGVVEGYPCLEVCLQLESLLAAAWSCCWDARYSNLELHAS